jgi:hypothetical protein
MPKHLINGISLIGFMRALKSIMLGIRVVQASSTNARKLQLVLRWRNYAIITKRVVISIRAEQAESVQTI